jgi:predicted amidohydrolase YtcJ
MREAHAHLAQHARAMSMLQLADSNGVQDCVTRVARRANDTPAAAWVLGIALRVESWPEQRYPSIGELDAAAGGIPVCLWSFDHHALVANTAALQAAGIDATSPDPEHGRIVRDASGRPTGLLLEQAAKLLWDRVPEPTSAQWRDLIKAAAEDLRGHGFTEVHDLLSQRWLGRVLADLSDSGELPLRVELFPLLQDFKALLNSRAAWERDDVRLAGAKLFADGTLNSRTASMLEPYADPLPGLPQGQAMLTIEELRNAMSLTAEQDLTLAVHAIGDAAVRTVLDARESLARPSGLRIEHAEIIAKADIPRFAQLGVTASMQPCHLLTDIEALRRAIPDRLHRVLPLRSLLDSGLQPGKDLIFGSDTPIVRPHPEDSIQAAVHRRRAGTPAGDAIAPEQAITAAEAWACFSPR